LNRTAQAFFLLVILGLAAAAGFVGGLMVNNRAFIPVSGSPFSPPNGLPNGEEKEPLNVDLIREAYDVIEENYAARETLEETNLTYAAITGMVEALGDTGHSRFLNPEMVEEEKRAIQGEFEGIGALLSTNEAGNPVILAPMDGSPAQRAGLRPGDIILAVDGEDVSTAPLSEVVRRVLGRAGTEVTLTILNPNTDQSREVTITRARIIVQNVTWQMLPGTSIAHVRVAAYSQGVANDLRDALTAAKAQRAEGILLDLRNNPGGLLNEAVEVVGMFLTEGNALQIQDSNGNVRSVRAGRGRVATDIPMVVLINQGSASAAEITAGALQDYERATLVGETTFGTGTVLNQFRLSDGSALLLATELWLTPEGRVIWHEGIQPDVMVELPAGVSLSIPETERGLSAEALRTLEDTQLLRGLELLEEKINP